MAPSPRAAALLGGGLLLAGLLFAAPFLLVPGAGLTLLALTLPWLARLQASGAGIERGLTPARIEEGAAFEVELRVSGGWLRARGEVRDPAARSPVPVRLPGRRKESLVRLDGAPLRRGRHDLPPPGLVISDPLGMSEQEVRGAGAGSLLVVPRVEPVVVPPGSAGGSLGETLSGDGPRGGGRSRAAPADPDLEGLRPHLDGSPASRIYWPALARTGELLERRFASRGGGGPTVALDARGAPGDEALDRAVRAAASLVHELARDGSCELVLPGHGGAIAVGPALSGWPGALAALATVEAGDAAAGPVISAGAPLIWVSASGGRPAAGTRGFLVSATPAPGRRIEFSVAGCHGQALDPAAAAPRGVAA